MVAITAQDRLSIWLWKSVAPLITQWQIKASPSHSDIPTLLDLLDELWVPFGGCVCLCVRAEGWMRPWIPDELLKCPCITCLLVLDRWGGWGGRTFQSEKEKKRRTFLAVRLSAVTSKVFYGARLNVAHASWIPPPFAWMDLNNPAGLGPDQVFQPSVLLKSVSPQQEEALKSPLGSCADSGTSMSQSNATFTWNWKEDLGPVRDSPVQFVLNQSKRRPMLSLVQEWLHTCNHVLMCLPVGTWPQLQPTPEPPPLFSSGLQEWVTQERWGGLNSFDIFCNRCQSNESRLFDIN